MMKGLVRSTCHQANAKKKAASKKAAAKVTFIIL